MKSQLRLFDESSCAVALPPPTDAGSDHAGLPAPPPSRDQLRSRRRRAVRAKTESMKRLPKRDLEAGRVEFPPEETAAYTRPKTRADCKDGPRPCPFVSCKHHLYLDVSAKTGAIKVNFPDVDPWELAESCALDVADRGGVTLETTGEIMNLTRERIRQVELRAVAQLEATKEMYALREHYGFVDRPADGKRRLPIAETRARVGERKRDDEDGTSPNADEHVFDPDGFVSSDLDD